MLADEHPEIRLGELSLSPQFAHVSRIGLIDFIVSQLPLWRDHAPREWKSGEDTLTHQLCTFLNAVSYRSDWSHVQFRSEVPDEIDGRRSIDMTIHPRTEDSFVAENRWLTIYDVLLPIECKRLPTPQKKGRDEREYVTTEPSSSGGIQRYKLGVHGANHSLAAMIGYVQNNTHSHWIGRVNGWINEVIAAGSKGWSAKDLIQFDILDAENGISVMRSTHTRAQGLDDIHLHHLWVQLPSA